MQRQAVCRSSKEEKEKDHGKRNKRTSRVQKVAGRSGGSDAAFGYVTEGMEIVDAICADAVPIDSNGLIASEEQPTILSIVIRE